ncbi:MAG: phage portal protein, partial [Clostridia bacterium]|nr:phage portal protein [Clostridia bacterium]
MVIWEWFLGLFDKDGRLSIDMAEAASLTAEIVIKEMAIGSAIGLISNALAKCEFQTFDKGIIKKGENYYRFNVEPNQNESAQYFWGKVIWRMVNNQKCLVIQNNDMYYVADSFEETKLAFAENIYYNVTIGDLKLNKTFRESEIFCFRTTESKTRILLDSLYTSYGKLITAGQNRYKKKGAFRGKLKVPITYPQTDKAHNEL